MREGDSFASARSVGRVTVATPVALLPRKESPVIFAATLPRVKAFLRPARLPAITVGLLVRLLTAFCHHPGRMSATAAADALRAHARHRAAITRFLARLRWSRDWSLLTAVADLLLQAE